MAKRGARSRSRNWQGSKWERADGRWGVELPVETPEGTDYLRSTVRDEGAADRWLTTKRYERDRDMLLSLDAERITVEKFLRSWLSDILPGTVSRHTYRDYCDKVEKHIIPELGRKKLRDLNRMHLQQLYRDKIDSGLSSRTVRYIHTTLSKALAEAEASDLVRKNVARQAKPPAPEHSERDPMSPREVRAFLTAVHGDDLEALYLLAVTTGLRRGELVGLKWADLDLEAGRLKVSRSLDTSYGPPVEKAPKRKASVRGAVLLPEVVSSLRAHRARQRQAQLRAGPRWEGDRYDYVFPTSLGTPQRADNLLRRSLKPLCQRAGLRLLTFTDLRHSCATFLALLEVHPATAKRMLGHSDISTTLNVYTHALDEMHEDAANRLRELFFDEPEESPADTTTPVSFLSEPDEEESEDPEEKENPA